MQTNNHQMQPQRSNKKVALVCVGVVVGMIGMSYAAVPLYDLFCRVTGYGGTTQVSADLATDVIDRNIEVRFDASLASGMPWRFKPVQVSQKLKVGEMGLAFYQASNPTDRTVVGTATYNVTPQKAGAYFAKIECFCFTEQVLMPGQVVDMPVSYFIDPAIDEDPNMDDVKTITLSYTFFETDAEDSTEQDVSFLLKQ